LTFEIVCTVPKPTGREGTASTMIIRENKATTILIDTTVQAALRDKPNMQQVPKLKTYQQGSMKSLLNKPARYYRKKKIVWKIQTGC
jgi:hypothetical protein